MRNWVMKITGQAVDKFKNATTLSRILQTQNTAQDDTGLVQLFGMAGQDSNPPIDSKAFVIPLGSSWKLAIAVDDGITPDSEVGEYQIYSQAEGAKKAALRLKPDGTILLESIEGDVSLNLNPDGTISLGNGTDELLDLFDQMLTELQKDVDLPGTSSTGTLIKINPALATIQGKLANIKI